MTDRYDLGSDFDGCHRGCRTKGVHSLIWGGCEHAVEPEPTVSLPRVYTAADGHPAIGFDTYTAQQLADLIEPGLRALDVPVSADYLRELAEAAAAAILNRPSA